MSAGKQRAPGIATLSFSSLDLEAMQALAAHLARLARPGDCLKLIGELGAGKTSFARAFIRELAPDAGEVVSPTFTLVQAYPAAAGTVWHYDLYRLKNAQELAELGLEEAFSGGITLIEWPEIAEKALPLEALDVSISMGDNAERRRLGLSGPAVAWRERLNLLKEYG